MEFKGTKGEWFAVEYGGYINIQDGVFYGADNLLDMEDVGKEQAESNALLISKAPEMLELLNRLAPIIERYSELETYQNVLQLIKDATTLEGYVTND